ncbi:HNH endonuclease [Gordonia phage Patio]|uniref:HNH endonuclease n=1 Tax=Gordonia phage Patio TaxID=2041515 RepID=A0A2D2W4Q9_9CAUD|nr:HNH endonuclease [Gordonia phage Patio]ATS93083.1 HNH endonuclease [Gordonia phage Patio]
MQGSVTTWDWKRALRRSRGRCFYCGERSSKLTVEHIIPLSRGGRHSIGNIVPACPTCNYQKQNRTVMEWRIWKQRRENAGTST